MEGARAVLGSAVEQASAAQLNAELLMFDAALSDLSNLTTVRFRRSAATVLAAAAALGVAMDAAVTARVTDALMKLVREKKKERLNLF
jgi:hypothetical protein